MKHVTPDIIDYLGEGCITFYTGTSTKGADVLLICPTEEILSGKATLYSFWEQRAELNCLDLEDFNIE
jgi:hypothetical protein